MKETLKIAVAGALLFMGVVTSSYSQNLVQPLKVSLTAFDSDSGKSMRITTKDMIFFFVGTNVHNGHLWLVTPPGNAPGELGNLNSFVRITSGDTIVLDVPSPTQFNLYQDAIALKPRGNGFTGRAVNRFSIDSGGVRAELQGISTWNISTKPVNGVDVSGAGAFHSSVNGWIRIVDVVSLVVPAAGTISAGNAKPEL